MHTVDYHLNLLCLYDFNGNIEVLHSASGLRGLKVQDIKRRANVMPVLFEEYSSLKTV